MAAVTAAKRVAMIRTETRLDLRPPFTTRVTKVLVAVPQARAESIEVRIKSDDDASVLVLDTNIERLSKLIVDLQGALLSATESLGIDQDDCEMSLCTIDGDGHIVALRQAFMSASRSAS